MPTAQRKGEGDEPVTDDPTQDSVATATAGKEEPGVSGGTITEADPSWPDEVVQPVEGQ